MNKNTRALLRAKRQAIRAHQSVVEFRGKKYEVSFGAGTVSTNRKRNMQMTVAINEGPNGKKESMTLHEPMIKGEFIRFKNHGNYENWNYFQPKNVQTSSAPRAQD